MGNQLVWQERFNMGVDFIDDEHKKLFGILNRMFMYEDHEAKGQWACREGIKYFKDHALKHFIEEEQYMASINYSGFETHRHLHDDFRTKILPSLETELEQTKYSADSISHFLGVCAGWLIGHTLIEDHAITGETTSRWNKLMPDDEQAAMKRLITRLLFDLFQLDAKLVSESYGGEKFGKGIYYRLVYDTEEDKKWEVILALEEKLVLNTIGVIMGIQSHEVNVMLVNAARYVAQQLTNYIRETFPSFGLHDLVEENLLEYEQFRAIFDEQNPQYSLLFNTGEGYFAYCIIAPHLLHNIGEIPIKAENAMNEVKKYIDNNKEDGKNKILIADDSGFMRKSMSELLGKDYDVMQADSGLSVIRSITLDRPDLILLDYDMPVCNGFQVLEMIRSEKEFKDIPVIFLTGRADRETVEKILPLNPEAYILKSLPPEQIKKAISNYFKRRDKVHRQL